MERRTSSSGSSGLHNVVVAGTKGQTVVDARTSLALWLRTARGERNMSLEDVARVTKIQPRILERLESGKADGLPADVFVRGFVRSFAKCVGLDEGEALRRYLACTGGSMPPGSVSASTSVRPVVLSGVEAPRAAAVVAAMSDLAPSTARDLVEVIHLSEPVQLAAGSLENLPRAEPEVLADAPAVESAPVVAEPVVVAEAAPLAEAPVVEAAAVEPAPAKKGKKSRKAAGEKKPRGKKGARTLATGTPSSPMPVVTQTEIDAIVATTATAAQAAATESELPAAVTPMVDAEGAVEAASTAIAAAATASAHDAPRPVYRPNADVDAFAGPVATSTAIDEIETIDSTEAELEAGSSLLDVAGAVDVVLDEPMMTMPIVDDEPAVSTAPWTPTMPVAPAATTPWKRSYFAPPTTTAPRGRAVVPSLVIDDADPDSAERELEERAQAGADVEQQGRRSFLPPILLDREDRSARQGGLTLAVILLLIAATLTLSYLMRRPSSSGDGYTSNDSPATLIG